MALHSGKVWSVTIVTMSKKSTILTNMKIFTSVLVQFGTYYFFLPGICTCISYLTKSKNTLFYPFFLKTHVLLE